MRGGGAGPFALGVLSQLLTVLRLWYEVSLEECPSSCSRISSHSDCPQYWHQTAPLLARLRRKEDDMLPPMQMLCTG